MDNLTCPRRGQLGQLDERTFQPLDIWAIGQWHVRFSICLLMFPKYVLLECCASHIWSSSGPELLADFSQGSDKKRVATAARLYDGLKLRAGARGGSLDGIQQPNLHTPPPPPSPWGGTEHGFLRFCKLYFSASVNWISQILNVHFSGIQPATQFVLYCACSEL